MTTLNISEMNLCNINTVTGKLPSAMNSCLEDLLLTRSDHWFKRNKNLQNEAVPAFFLDNKKWVARIHLSI
jgi:predicted DNA-binding protein (MmcQ/YjbR family)